MKNNTLWNKIKLKNFLWIFWYSSANDKSLLVNYFEIWSLTQWVSSIFTLVLMYWVSGYFYNKFLSNKGGWMDTKTRIIMIVFDLLVNFSLGIVCMNYRETLIGALMIKCPVFFSPLFWFVELICFYIYYRYIATQNKKLKK